MLHKKLGVLYLNSFLKEYNSKTLISLFVLTIIIILLIISVDNFASKNLGQSIEMTGLFGKKIILFYGIISMWNGVLATLLGVNCVKSDYEFNLLPQLLAFPLSRSHYLAIRILGAWTIVELYYLVSLILGISLFSITDSTFNFDIKVFYAFAICSITTLIIISLSVFFSLLFNKLISFIITIFTSMAVAMSNSYYSEHPIFEKSLSEFNLFTALGAFFHCLLPRLETFNKISNLVLANKEVNFNLWAEFGHLFFSLALLYLITLQLFKRIEI
ncbi:MAG: hypothetical protein ISR65_17330 [Bacteriovoracaceae bacterium]|nr:hypothetical protein [Bacteriovoracaceae bacterium]